MATHSAPTEIPEAEPRKSDDSPADSWGLSYFQTNPCNYICCIYVYIYIYVCIYIYILYAYKGTKNNINHHHHPHHHHHHHFIPPSSSSSHIIYILSYAYIYIYTYLKLMRIYVSCIPIVEIHITNDLPGASATRGLCGVLLRWGSTAHGGWFIDAFHMFPHWLQGHVTISISVYLI